MNDVTKLVVEWLNAQEPDVKAQLTALSRCNFIIAVITAAQVNSLDAIIDDVDMIEWIDVLANMGMYSDVY